MFGFLITFKDDKEKFLVKHSDTTMLGFMPIIDKVLKATIIFLALATILDRKSVV